MTVTFTAGKLAFIDDLSQHTSSKEAVAEVAQKLGFGRPRIPTGAQNISNGRIQNPTGCCNKRIEI